MGLGGISIWQLVIILVIVLLLFGTKRLRGLGGDLGGAIKGFKKAIKDDTQAPQEKPSEDAEGDQTRADADEPEATTQERQKSETKQ